MKNLMHYGFILGVICLVASGLLAAVNEFTRPKIIAQAQAQEDATLKELLPEAARFEAVKSGDEVLYFKGNDSLGRFVGIVFKASGKGYSSVIETMVGMTADDKITGIKVVNQNETPGLGSRIAQADFTTQFTGKGSSSINQVQAITGATISSRAVINAVAAQAEAIKDFMKHEK
jgi:electron transport complex protein RnfG